MAILSINIIIAATPCSNYSKMHLNLLIRTLEKASFRSFSMTRADNIWSFSRIRLYECS